MRPYRVEVLTPSLDPLTQGSRAVVSTLQRQFAGHIWLPEPGYPRPRCSAPPAIADMSSEWGFFDSEL